MEYRQHLVWPLSRRRLLTRGCKSPHSVDEKVASMISRIKNFLQDESAQDLIEYTLLMAFVAMASAALFIGAGGSIKGIWTSSNSQLEAANVTAGG
jgi:Flp pilus assembly pilin Flp